MKLNYIPPQFNDGIVLSILKEHSDKIFSGAKKFELRKVIPKNVPRRVYVYEAEGSKSIVGHFVVDRVLSAPPSLLWEAVGGEASTRQRFFKYFENRSVGYAYEISVAVRYSRAIPFAELQVLDPSLSIPQSFQYLDFYSPARRHLVDAATAAAISPMESGGLILEKIGERDIETFIGMVKGHITENYRETGEQYARKLLEISKAGSDPEGVITQSKIVFLVKRDDELIGFVVVTEKAGGSLKTGPTLLLEKFQHRGIGVELRKRLHEYAHRLGFRKVYCTFPASKIEYSKYLFRSGYHLEAHLKKHYHPDHDELVFGYHLSRHRFGFESPQRSYAELMDVRRLESVDEEVIQFLNENFPREICPVPSGWASDQVRIAASCTKRSISNLPFKPRWIFVGRGIAVEAVCLAIFKRGGSVKLILVTSTGNAVGLENMISAIERSVLRSKLPVRKLYTHVRVGDGVIFDAFSSLGYAPEGLLERPYVDWQDTIVVGKLVDQPKTKHD